MHFAVVLSVFIHPCAQKQRRAQYSRGVDAAVCVRALQMCVCACASDVCVCARFRCLCAHALQMCVRARASDVCACARFRCVCVRALQMCVRALQCAENFSHSARLLLQQSRASFMLASCFQAVLISSPDM